MKKEQTLIKKRTKRARELKAWQPTREEFWEIVLEQWEKLLLNYDTKDNIRGQVQLVLREYQEYKHLIGSSFMFGEFKGQPGEISLIVLYTLDILCANYFQKDLCRDHIYFILEHELKHYFGATHEDMETITEFGYPK